MDRRKFFGWLGGMLYGLLGGSLSRGGAVPKGKTGREVYRRTPGGSTMENCRPAFIWVPIAWEDQRPGDVILCMDWRDGRLTGMQWWVTDTAPAKDAMGTIQTSRSGEFHYSAPAEESVTKSQLEAFRRGGLPEFSWITVP